MYTFYYVFQKPNKIDLFSFSKRSGANKQIKKNILFCNYYQLYLNDTQEITQSALFCSRNIGLYIYT